MIVLSMSYSLQSTNNKNSRSSFIVFAELKEIHYVL